MFKFVQSGHGKSRQFVGRALEFSLTWPLYVSASMLCKFTRSISLAHPTRQAGPGEPVDNIPEVLSPAQRTYCEVMTVVDTKINRHFPGSQRAYSITQAAKTDVRTKTQARLW